MFLVPDFKGFDFFPHDTRLPFMKFKTLCFALSLLFMALSLGVIATKGFNFGVDFKGGSLIEVQAKSGKADIADIRSKLGALGLGDVQIQSFGTEADVLIRVEQQPGGDEAQQAGLKKVIDALGADFEQRRVEVVGPAVSSELRTTGIIAVLASILAIIIYVWFRFEWQFAMGVVVGTRPRRADYGRRLLAVPDGVRSLDGRGAAHHPRLLGERLRRRGRPHS